jgi:hypothetical protein
MFGFVPIFVGFVVLSRKLSGGKKFWMSDVSSRCKEHVIGTRYVGNHARLEIRYRHRKNSAPGNFHFQGKIGDEELKSDDWVTPVCYHASQTKLRDLANTIKTTVDSSMRSYGSKHEILLRMIPHAIVAAK